MSLTKTRLTFDQFLNYDFPEEGRYELVNGEIMRIQATRKHDNLAEFIADTFKLEVIIFINYWLNTNCNSWLRNQLHMSS